MNDDTVARPVDGQVRQGEADVEVSFEWVLCDESEIPVASGVAPTNDEACREGSHYMVEYAIDGECALDVYKVTREKVGGYFTAGMANALVRGASRLDATVGLIEAERIRRHDE